MTKHLVARPTNSSKLRVPVVHFYTTAKNTPLLIINNKVKVLYKANYAWMELPKKSSSKGRRKPLSADSVPGRYINTGYLSTQSVICELHFDSSSDNIDNGVNHRHVPRSIPARDRSPV